MSTTASTDAQTMTDAIVKTGPHASTPPESPTRPRTVPLEELRRAWAALEDGTFAPHAPSPSTVQAATTRASTSQPMTMQAPAVLVRTDEPPTTEATVWTPGPGEQVLPVVGCGGSCGASTVAVALATTALSACAGPDREHDDPPRVGHGGGWDAARVVDCGSLAASGLVAASASELGRDASGWWRGTRGDVVLQRGDGYVAGPDTVPPPGPIPVPGPGHRRLTVLDVGWHLEQVLHHPCWLRTTLRTASHVVLVTTATVPGLRRLEVHLDLLSNPTEWSTGSSAGSDVPRAVVVVLGPPRRRWPRAVAHSLGTRSRALEGQGQLTIAPHDRRLAVSGLDPAPLPAKLLRTATGLLDHLIIDSRGAIR